LLAQLLAKDRGILDAFGPWPASGQDPAFYYYQAAVHLPRNQIALTAGVSTNADHAKVKAVGEAIERFCAATFRDENHFFGSYLDYQDFAVRPSSFALFSDQQYQDPSFPFQPFTSQSQIHWTPCRHAKTGSRHYLPACSVFVPYTFRVSQGEVPVMQPVSTGLAAHKTFAEAALHATLEVIERDCIAITWQARLSRPKLDLSTLEPEHLDAMERFARLGYDIQILSIRNDLPIPVFMGVMRNERPEYPPLVVSAAAHLNPSRAVMKCLEELALMERAMKATMPLERKPGPADFRHIRTFYDQLQIWTDPDFADHAAFLAESDVYIQLRDIPNGEMNVPEESLKYVIDCMDRIGYDLYLKDLTIPYMENLGWKVVKAVIPGFHPVASGHVFRSLGGRRLWQLPQKLGYAGLDPAIGDNPIPSPFA